MPIDHPSRPSEPRKRTPTDGRPYYCRLCGCGFAEYLACELPDCALESERKAKIRQRGKKANKVNHD